MSEPEINYQCYICPVCFDDHSIRKTTECVEQLKQRLEEANNLIDKFIDICESYSLPVSDAEYSENIEPLINQYLEKYGVNYE